MFNVSADIKFISLNNVLSDLPSTIPSDVIKQNESEVGSDMLLVSDDF